MTKMVKNAGMGLLGALDSYIITMIKTEDKRRALIDLDSITKVEEEIEKDIVTKVTKDIKDIAKGMKIDIS